MKGLQLAEDYYTTVGEQMIIDSFGDLANRIAVGMVGPGSECFGFDDEISRDHDWGPAFSIWVNSDDYKKYGVALQNAYNNLPKVFKGFGPRIVSPGEEGRIGVCDMVTFYRTYTGLDHVPVSLKEWFFIPGQSLATCTNGKVFHDALGEFTRWREALLAFYPEDVRLKKIASRCATIAQSGQYNLPRSLKRGESFSAHFAVTQFCTEIMSLVFLLNKRYAPFYKWLHRSVFELPLLGKWTYSLVADLITPTNLNQKLSMIENACAVVIRELKAEGLTDSTSDFLLDHGRSVHNRIRDASLRERFTVVD
jgi:hypothetical protein